MFCLYYILLCNRALKNGFEVVVIDYLSNSSIAVLNHGNVTTGINSEFEKIDLKEKNVCY